AVPSSPLASLLGACLGFGSCRWVRSFFMVNLQSPHVLKTTPRRGQARGGCWNQTALSLPTAGAGRAESQALHRSHHHSSRFAGSIRVVSRTPRGLPA